MSSSAINVKLLLIGNSSVGKSSLLLRFSDEQWLPEDEASATIGVDFRVSCALRSLMMLTRERLRPCQGDATPTAFLASILEVDHGYDYEQGYRT